MWPEVLPDSRRITLLWRREGLPAPSECPSSAVPQGGWLTSSCPAHHAAGSLSTPEISGGAVHILFAGPAWKEWHWRQALKRDANTRKSGLTVTQFSFLRLFFFLLLKVFFNEHVWFIMEKKLIYWEKQQQKEFLQFGVELEIISWFLEKQLWLSGLALPPTNPWLTQKNTYAR